jgi:hypothetical protein
MIHCRIKYLLMAYSLKKKKKKKKKIDYVYRLKEKINKDILKQQYQLFKKVRLNSVQE